MKAGIQHFATRSPVHSWSRLCIERRICLSFCYLASTHSSIRGLVVSFFVTPSLVRGYRNINLLSIDYAFQPHLRSRLTQGGRTFPWKPWSIGVTDSHCHFATHTGILTSIHSSTPYGIPSTRIERSPTTLDVTLKSIVSVSCLAPVNFRRRVTRLVSCYALFQGWLLLSQPPSCLCIPTSFST